MLAGSTERARPRARERAAVDFHQKRSPPAPLHLSRRAARKGQTNGMRITRPGRPCSRPRVSVGAVRSDPRSSCHSPGGRNDGVVGRGACAVFELERLPTTAGRRRTARRPHPASLPVCRLWAQLRYLHPWVAGGAVDGDAVLLAALPGALSAQTDVDEVAAVRVLARGPARPRHARGGCVDAWRRSCERAPRCTARDGRRRAGLARPREAVGRHGPRRRRADEGAIRRQGRRHRPSCPRGQRQLPGFTSKTLDRVATRLVTHTASAPAQRVVQHRGYQPQTGVTNGGYGLMLATLAPTRYMPASGPHPAHVVFLTNNLANVPAIAWAMQSTGDASVVAQGKLGLDAVAATRQRPSPRRLRCDRAHFRVRGLRSHAGPPARRGPTRDQSPRAGGASRTTPHCCPCCARREGTRAPLQLGTGRLLYPDAPFPRESSASSPSFASGASSTLSIRTSR